MVTGASSHTVSDPSWSGKAAALGNEVYELVCDTPLKKVIYGVTEFLNANAYMIFWGGALISLATKPHMFAIGACTGIAAAVLLPDSWDLDVLKVQLGPLHRMARVVILVWSYTIPKALGCMVGGMTPGYHIYKACTGQYYGGLKGAKALWFEFEYMCWELSQWIPFIEVHEPPHVLAAEVKAKSSPSIWA